MGKQLNEDYAEQWIALYDKAANLLPPKRFQQWLLSAKGAVTYQQQCKVGEAILEKMLPSCSVIHIEISAKDNASEILREISDAIAEAARP